MSIVTFVERKGNEIIAYRGAVRQFSGEMDMKFSFAGKSSIL
jgi:hypothetical protein